MKDMPQYWNPLLETLPRERLQALQLKKFRRILQWAYDHSTFHRSLYDRAGIRPEDVRSLADVTRVPKVEKGMLRDIQSQAPFPYGAALCVPVEEVTAFHQTSGTSGQPVYQPDTWQDWEWWSECWCYVLWAQGYRPLDRVFIPFGYNIFVAFWAGHYAAEKIGCEVVPGGVLDSKQRILKIQELKATAMMCTPTYVLGLAHTARNTLGIDPANLGLRRITCAGEPGASVPSTKQRMETAWDARVYDHAGATEIGAWSFECTEQPGAIHVNEAFFLVEIEDFDTGEIINEPGKQGKLIITALDRQAMPCIRFDSKDVGEWASAPCPCGRSFRMLQGGIVGRTDDITKVKGVLLAPTAIEEIVRGMPDLGNEYSILVDRVGDRDRITLKVELTPEAQGQRQGLEAELRDRLRARTHLRYELEFHDLGSLPRYQVKAKRFTDLRKTREDK